MDQRISGGGRGDGGGAENNTGPTVNTAVARWAIQKDYDPNQSSRNGFRFHRNATSHLLQVISAKGSK